MYFSDFYDNDYYYDDFLIYFLLFLVIQCGKHSTNAVCTVSTEQQHNIKRKVPEASGRKRKTG